MKNASRGFFTRYKCLPILLIFFFYLLYRFHKYVVVPCMDKKKVLDGGWLLSAHASVMQIVMNQLQSVLDK